MSTAPNRKKVEARMEAFIEELNELTRRHKVKINGCGCCGSPYLQDCSTDLKGKSYTAHTAVEVRGTVYRHNLEWEESKKS